MAITNDVGEEEIEMMMKYLIVRPEKGGIFNMSRYLLRYDAANHDFIETSNNHYSNDGYGDELVTVSRGISSVSDGGGGQDDHRLVIIVSIIVRKIIGVLGKPMEWMGYLVEFLLNLLSLNGGSIFSLLTALLNGKVVRPQRNSETFISAIGHLDGRIDLYNKQMPSSTHDDPLLSSTDANGNGEMIVNDKKTSNIFDLGDDRCLMDLCMMASKLAYENAKVVRNIVVHHWKMHFVEFFNGWNDFQKEKSTQVFILCDKPVDANLILISFRGTEPFDADDWSTDFDYSWYDIPKLGKVHMGFLEALGLGNRDQVTTFHNHLQAVGGRDGYNSKTSFPDEDAKSDATRKKRLLPEMAELTAYYAVRTRLKELLNEHKNAKFLVTGHSLGGALAILFPSVLVLHEEMEMMNRLLCVYTFGQPRIGDRQLGRYMEPHLNYPTPRYFRVVYCNDLVPRLPYDNNTFLFKHFGPCLYYNSLYIETELEEEPNPNFYGIKFLIPEYLNAAWEFARSLTMGYTHGPEYKEGWFCILLRLMGLALPGISAHCPADYVNSVRLGRMSSSSSSSYSSSI
ncbi:hypothetical protein C5167_027606 [Papaver somniferum]|uniref:uncharacterized protein LOC113340256 n=1 Tax=Papaver somniferum TaxID=3469 RepID=UPI000E6F67CA|nr:uncharacterized protein LOC113340256 [Papaver somniferum]RZC91538.1 hypothetical protein C5167_027606 [Papaver somniferum]